MDISNKKLGEFRKLYKKRFGIDISNETAKEIGLALIEFLRPIYSPMDRSEYELLKKKLGK